MKKLITSAILSSVMLVSSVGAIATHEMEQVEIWDNLTDRNITNSEWSTHYVGMGYAHGLLDNTNLTKNADLRNNITREDFTEIVMNYVRVHMTEFQIENERSEVNGMFYMDTSNWNVLLATQLGVVNGVGNNNFNPNGNITRQEVATILARVEKLVSCKVPSIREEAELRKYKDVDKIDMWARYGVGLMTNLDVINGKNDGNFDPLGNTKQEEAIKMIVELYEMKL